MWCHFKARYYELKADGGRIEMFWILNSICVINFNFLMTKYITNSTKSSFWPYDAILRQDGMKRQPKAAILEIGGHIEAVRIFWEFKKITDIPFV